MISLLLHQIECNYTFHIKLASPTYFFMPPQFGDLFHALLVIDYADRITAPFQSHFFIIVPLQLHITQLYIYIYIHTLYRYISNYTMLKQELKSTSNTYHKRVRMIEIYYYLDQFALKSFQIKMEQL